MKDNEIHIGDVLQIRSFEDMKSEFGFEDFGLEDGWIIGKDGVCFTKEMIYLCGSVFTVSKITQKDNRYYYRSVEGIEIKAFGHPWFIAAWMLEPYSDDTEWEVADDNQIALLLS